MAVSLSSWGTNTFGEVRQELRILRKRLLELWSIATRFRPTYEEIKLKQQIIELRFREEVMWLQRARVQLLPEGDRNTQFFHQKASNRRKKNRVMQLVWEDGTVCEDPAMLENMTVEFYENLYASEGVIGIEEVLSHMPSMVTPEMNEMLQRSYTESEVKTTLFQMFPTKALGPDCFLAHFFQMYWHLCGEEVTKIVIRVLKG